ncbi:MAG: BON domain-containing protein [Bryobacteraceae bacterium]
MKILLFLLPFALMAADNPQPKIAQEVRHQLLSLPYYNVFDDLAYRVDGTRVTLFGQVVRPLLKDEAASAVKKIEGVTAVDNQIEILPVSGNDQQLRLALFHAIYSRPELQRYAIAAVPAIHIIVKNGNATLLGSVSSQADKNIAGIAASGVPGVFKVANGLMVENSAG